MKFNKTKWSKHILMFTLLVFFGLLASGSMEDDNKKVIKQYEKGNYEKAKEIAEGNSYFTNVINEYDIIACYYVGLIYENEGNEEKALKYKIPAYNKVLDSRYADRVDAIVPKLSSRIYFDSQLKQQLAKQEKEQAAKAAAEALKKFIGVWKFYTVNKDGKSYNKANLLRYPKVIVLREDGTGYINTPTASGADSKESFTWTANGNKVSTSLSYRFGMSPSGYLTWSGSALKVNMGLEHVDVFFKKE